MLRRGLPNASVHDSKVAYLRMFMFSEGIAKTLAIHVREAIRHAEQDQGRDYLRNQQKYKKYANSNHRPHSLSHPIERPPFTQRPQLSYLFTIALKITTTPLAFPVRGGGGVGRGGAIGFECDPKGRTRLTLASGQPRDLSEVSVRPLRS